MAEHDFIEPERLEGTPHPRDTEKLYGQSEAEARFLEAYQSGRLHHAWLMSGPQGVGKATMAWRIARFLLTRSEDDNGPGLFENASPQAVTLDIAADDPVVTRMQAGSEPRLFKITRSVNPETKRLRDMIVVDDVRALGRFLSMSAAEGGRRVVIVDAADEMNTQAANALLKMLEEPPRLTTFLLVAHQPAALLPTIRSRCRELRLAVLGPENMSRALRAVGLDQELSKASAGTLAALSGGSVGAAARLLKLDGLSLYSEILGTIATLPNIDRARVQHLAGKFSMRGAEEELDLFCVLLEMLLFRLARAGASGDNAPADAQEAEIFARLSPDIHAARRWARLSDELLSRLRHGRAVNLDAAALILDTFLRIQRSVAGQSKT